VLRPVLSVVVLVAFALALPAGAVAAELPDPLGEGPAIQGPCIDTTAPPAPVARAAAGPGVRALVRRAARAGALTDEQAREFSGAWTRALVARTKLSGQRRAELTAVINTLQSFAIRGLLTSSRMPVLFRQLDVNTRWWSRYGAPRKQATPGASRPCTGGNGTGGNRIVRDEAVYQWYPGQGLQIQQLGTFGRANALARDCLEERTDCRPAALRRALDGIVSLAVNRAGFAAWEYYFAFGGGRAPWISGMAQATAMQALVRGAEVLGDPSYLDVARRAVGAFARRYPVGVRAPTRRGSHYLLYSFDPGLRVYNGFMQALVGLYDYAEAAGDARARRLFDAGEREMRTWILSADTGAWTLYSQSGRESDLGYHRVLRDFVAGLCERTKRQRYCAAAARFTGYMHERTRVNVLSISPLRVRRASRVRFALSKISCVTLTIRRNGREVGVIGRVFGRGAAEIAWTPSRRGRYELELKARDLVAHNTYVKRTVTVR
jgi:hypothetical protein